LAVYYRPARDCFAGVVFVGESVVGRSMGGYEQKGRIGTKRLSATRIIIKAIPRKRTDLGILLYVFPPSSRAS
jgi:hypothetical protein